LKLQEKHGSFDAYIWKFVGGKPLKNQWETLEEVPCWDDHSNAMTKALKEEGMTFVGTKICYSFMQAVGMVNDHLILCFVHKA
jgi:DNA-3-methyladenine glycosylase I